VKTALHIDKVTLDEELDRKIKQKKAELEKE
jgi:hypothetical protein